MLSSETVVNLELTFGVRDDHAEFQVCLPLVLWGVLVPGVMLPVLRAAAQD